MAGAGARLFPENSKLTSAQVNTYLMDQTIMRFATTSARDAAFGGVGEPTLAEGMTCYIDADNSIYTYDGSNWVKMVSASQPPGLVHIQTQSVSNNTTMQFDNCFSSEFVAYKFVLNVTSSSVASQGISLRFGNGSTFADTNYGVFFHYLVAGLNPSNGNWAVANYNGTAGFVNQVGGSVHPCTATGDISSPFLATPTMYNCWSNTSYNSGIDVRGVLFGGGGHNTSTSYSSLRFFGSNNWSGVGSIYGYRNS